MMDLQGCDYLISFRFPLLSFFVTLKCFKMIKNLLVVYMRPLLLNFWYFRMSIGEKVSRLAVTVRICCSSHARPLYGAVILARSRIFFVFLTDLLSIFIKHKLFNEPWNTFCNIKCVQISTHSTVIFFPVFLQL